MYYTYITKSDEYLCTYILNISLCHLTFAYRK